MPTTQSTRRNAVGGPAAHLRRPVPSDGPAVHALVAACPPLDPNSLYCNLLQCTHFAGTSALAEAGGEVVGFVSGYRPPADPDSLFVWQVAVSGTVRGQGLGRRLMLDILARPENRGLRFVRTTITNDNAASWAMFDSLARQLGAATRRQVLFDADRHFAGQHDSEHELVIGPFDSARIAH
jgi:L-2,4-diaminobutyric acid acetyltransferase